MKQTVFMALAASCLFLASCSKKSNPKPATPTNEVEYTFSADASGKYVMNYYDGVSLGSSQSITASTWTQKITIPTGIKNANIFFSAGQNPPFTANNTATVTIKLNGKVVATGSKVMISTSTLAEAKYSYIGE